MRYRHSIYTMLLAIALIGCDLIPFPPAKDPDTIDITITGLPAELNANARISGPLGYERELSDSITLTGLTPGRYTVSAADVSFRQSVFNPDQRTREVTLEPGGYATSILAYAPHRIYSQAATERLNEHRAAAGLDLVTLDGDSSLPNWLHARYLAENRVTGHSEDPDLPWYSTAGHAAGQASSLIYHGSPHYLESWEDPSWIIDGFLDAPFHLFGLLSPTVTTVRIGSYYSPSRCASEPCDSSDWHWNVGVVQDIEDVAWPDGEIVRFPAAGQTINRLEHEGETPSPLTACPGYDSPAGLPIFTMSGLDDTPDVTSTSLTRNRASVEHCTFTTDSYTNPDGNLQALGRSILNWYGAVVLVPRQPLEPNSNYTVTISSGDGDSKWSFHTGDTFVGSSGTPKPVVD